MEREFENIIIGIDPGTNVMGYALLGVNGKKPQLIVMGVLQLSRMEDHYMRLRHIYERVSGVIDEYLPDEMAIEAPFYGKNVQSMLKLGRAQGVAMVAALNREIPIAEYEPRKIKMAIPHCSTPPMPSRQRFATSTSATSLSRARAQNPGNPSSPSTPTASRNRHLISIPEEKSNLSTPN